MVRIHVGEFEFDPRRTAWFQVTPRLIFFTEDGRAIEFDPQKHRALILESGYIKSGKWSRTWYRIRLPEGVYAMELTSSDRNGRFCSAKSWKEFTRQYVAYYVLRLKYKLNYGQNPPADEVERLADTLATSSEFREAIRKAAPSDAAAFDADETSKPTIEDVFPVTSS